MGEQDVDRDIAAGIEIDGGDMALVMGDLDDPAIDDMYVGLLLTLLAWAVFLANPFAALWVVVYVLYITRFQIIPEERVLTSLFGAEYEAYKGRVRRWV